MLGRVPPLPDRRRYGLLASASFPSFLSTKWRITGSGDCDVASLPEQTSSVLLRLQSSSPTNVTLNGDSFRKWTEWEGNEAPNLLAVLTLAWSYILSARLVELQGSHESLLSYTQSAAPVERRDENRLNVSVDVGDVDSRTMRWFTAILTPGVGFRATLDKNGKYSSHSPWAYSLPVHAPHFSIECRECDENVKMTDETPLTSHQGLQSLITFVNRCGVSSHQLHAALATALLFPTLNSLRVHAALPRPAVGNMKPSPVGLGSEELNLLTRDLPYYMTLSCASEVVNSSLCGVFWNPYISSNLASPWLKPVLDLKYTKTCQDAPGHYNEILAVISARRAPNIAYLCLAAAISGFTSTILKQVLKSQQPLDRHAFAWTGVPQSFMDLAGEGDYYEMHFSRPYIRRADCWRLRKLPPTVDDDLHYGSGPFTPWAPPGYGLLKNCPLRVQVHQHCYRHALAYEGATWLFSDAIMLENDLGRDAVTPHVFKDRVFEESDVSHDIESLDNEGTSIDATVCAFTWVLVNGEGIPPEDVYKDSWLLGIADEDSENEERISGDDSSDVGGSQGDGNRADYLAERKVRMGQDATVMDSKSCDNGMLNVIHDAKPREESAERQSCKES